MARGQELGSHFEYRLEMPLTLPRQQSALLPIVNQEVSAEQVSVYNSNVHPKYPLYADVDRVRVSGFEGSGLAVVADATEGSLAGSASWVGVSGGDVGVLGCGTWGEAALTVGKSPSEGHRRWRGRFFSDRWVGVCRRGLGWLQRQLYRGRLWEGWWLSPEALPDAPAGFQVIWPGGRQVVEGAGEPEVSLFLWLWWGGIGE